MIHSGNLFAQAPANLPREQFQNLLTMPGMLIERIVSTGQATPAGEWLRQDWTEWVVVLSGLAGLRLDGEAEPRLLRPGDWLTIPRGLRHRVDWTAPDMPTIWLAAHVGKRSNDVAAADVDHTAS